jgi:hypothetical protein
MNQNQNIDSTAGTVAQQQACSACEELRREVAHLMTKRVKLHAECQKYRVALNRVAHPETWGVNPGHHVEIARRALVIGMKVDPLPESAKISQPNANEHPTGRGGH